MDSKDLKIINISSKGFKRQLILSNNEVETLRQFLTNTIKNEVMIINTNLGLDVYYHSFLNQDVFIKSAFSVMIIAKGIEVVHFRFHYLNTNEAIMEATKDLFRRMPEMPLIFKGYTKSLFVQLQLQYPNNKIILGQLFSLWQTVLLRLRDEIDYNPNLNTFLSLLQQSYIINRCSPSLKKLIEDAIDKVHLN